MMKRNLKMMMAAAMMAAVVAVSAGCSGSQGSGAQEESAQSGGTQESSTQGSVAQEGDGQLKVGIIQLIENGAFNDMREGFIQELRDQGYSEDRLVIDYKCAQGDTSNLQTIAQGMADGSYDLVATIATPATQAMVNLESDTPVIFVAVSAPVQAIAKIVIEHDIFVISDEIYSELTYSGDHATIAALPEMKERTVLINGFSKSYAMTGWRLGYAAAPANILEQMLKIHQYAIMCAPTTSQYAAVSALRDGDGDVAMMRESYNQRRRYLLHAFKEMNIDCFEPMGAFYTFPNIKRFGMSSDEFATTLLKEEKVAVVPGTAFGDCGEGFLRISYAYSLEDLKRALERIDRFIKRLDGK